MMQRKQPPECFYCGALVSGNGVGDHFPIPRNAGGNSTVPCCQSCHDMKDRFSLHNWPSEWTSAIINDFPKMSRETRIFLAKTMRVAIEATAQLNKSAEGERCYPPAYDTPTRL